MACLLRGWIAARCWIFTALLLAGVLPGAGLAQSQQAQRAYLNRNVVHLPIQIDERERPKILEVQLYVKEGPQAPWTLRDKAPATQPFFSFRAARDGEYWFSVVTLDRSGRTVPQDVTKEAPGLIVVVDTTPPAADVQNLGAAPEGHKIHCAVVDANPDQLKTRFYFQTRDQMWRPLEAVPGQPNQFLIPVQAATTGLVRVLAADLAGNMATREVNLGAVAAAQHVAPAALQQDTNPEKIQQTASHVPVPEPTGFQERVVPPGGLLKAPEKHVPLSQRVEVISGNKTQQPMLPPMPPGFKPDNVEDTSKPPFAVDPEMRSPEKPALKTMSPTEPHFKRHIVNRTRIVLDYQIEQQGASGVGRVEIWCTRDMGQTWQRLGEDADKKSPADIDLPGEGVYGLSLVVSNGRGFGGNMPKAGDTPDWWIEVDSTRPRAELVNVRSAPGDDGALHVTWTAKDKNLHTEPIDLYFATNRTGPWQPIAKGLPNEGHYRWLPVGETGSHAFVRLVVQDQAGNVTTSETLQPVALDDLSRPRGRLVGLSTAAAPMTPSAPANVPAQSETPPPLPDLPPGN
ncbi:MAG: hypothetical protein L0Y72_16675 [Gemmataceae bacterium]|nr:hypothetical protein [Gemmataceae bacterium]MCI0740685.1 hypothetical protein [Gemmataceae bacterium]